MFFLDNELYEENATREVLVDISDIVVSEASVSDLQGNQLWMRPEKDVGH